MVETRESYDQDDCVDGEIRKGELCKLPMYDTKGEIVRGINKEIPLDPSPWKGLSK